MKVNSYLWYHIRAFFYQLKTPFQRNSVLLTGHHATPVVTLFFGLAHVTCMALHHTVVISYSTSVTYRTLCHASGHLLIYCECYRFERAFFTLRRFFTLHSFLLFQGFHVAGSSVSKLAELHADLRNMALVRLFI